MKKVVTILVSMTLLMTITGCLYPQDRRAENQIPYEDQLASVQLAVEQFREDTDVLPIKTRDQSVPIYQKYPIDFNRLIPRYLQEPPGNSFENGGLYQYVLVNVEEDPTVKLIDLTIVDTIREYRSRVNNYIRENDYPPFEKVLDTHVFILNHKELGYDAPPQVKSPISGEYLPLIVNGEGDIFIDYSVDLYHLLQKYDHNYQTGDDVRPLIHEHSPFVPVFSMPYTVKDNEPIFLK